MKPPITGQSYEDLAIRDGYTASRENVRLTFGKPGPGERKRVLRQLEEYCGMDTEGMWQIVPALPGLV